MHFLLCFVSSDIILIYNVTAQKNPQLDKKTSFLQNLLYVSANLLSANQDHQQTGLDLPAID